MDDSLCSVVKYEAVVVPKLSVFSYNVKMTIIVDVRCKCKGVAINLWFKTRMDFIPRLFCKHFRQTRHLCTWILMGMYIFQAIEAVVNPDQALN